MVSCWMDGIVVAVLACYPVDSFFDVCGCIPRERMNRLFKSVHSCRLALVTSFSLFFLTLQPKTIDPISHTKSPTLQLGSM